MAELEEFEPQINTSLDRFEKMIKGIDKKEYSEKQTVLRKAEQLKRTIKDLIDSYELEINNLERVRQYAYTEPLNAINKRFNELKQELEFKKSEGTNQKELFGVRLDEKTNTSELNAQQLIQLGHETQAKGNLALDNIIATVEKGNQLAIDINLELDKQIEQLDRMEQTLKDTQTVLKRVQVLLRYFFRQIYTDKIIMALICCIFLAIVIIVILSAIGKNGGNFNVPDIV